MNSLEKNYSSKSLADTAAIARNWIVGIVQSRAKFAEKAFVVGLSGHLGAGKTSFVKLVAHELGVTETVTSPTFVLMKIYEINKRMFEKNSADNINKNEFFQRLVHIDAYRLEKKVDLTALKFEDIVADPKNLVMIEWPENVELTATDMNSWIEFEIKDGVYMIQIK